MSGVIWGGAQASKDTDGLRDALSEEYGLTPAERSVVSQLIHTLTYYRTYSHDEAEERIRVLLDHSQPRRRTR